MGECMGSLLDGLVVWWVSSTPGSCITCVANYINLSCLLTSRCYKLFVIAGFFNTFCVVLINII